MKIVFNYIQNTNNSFFVLSRIILSGLYLDMSIFILSSIKIKDLSYKLISFIFKHLLRISFMPIKY